MTQLLTRDIRDLGLSIEVEVPEGWGELVSSGLALVVGGVVDEDRPTRAPSVAVCIDAGGTQDGVAAAVERQTADLVDRVVLVDEARVVGEDSVRVLEVVHGSLDGPRQISMVKIVLLADTGLVVQTVGSCGAGASEDARAVVRAAVAGCRVIRTASPAGQVDRG